MCKEFYHNFFLIHICNIKWKRMEIVHVRTMFWDVIGNRLHRMLCYRPSKKRTLCYHGYDLLECWYLEEYPICRAFTSGYKTYSGTPRGEVPASPPGDTGKTLALPPTAPPPLLYLTTARGAAIGNLHGLQWQRRRGSHSLAAHGSCTGNEIYRPCGSVGPRLGGSGVQRLRQ